VTAVVIAEEVLGAIAAHARAEAPNECCGLLVGNESLIETSTPARNVLASPSRYRIDPRDHFALLKRTRAEGKRIVGAYHSHPRTAAEPSERDVAEAYDPELLYLIVSMNDERAPQFRCFQIRDGAVTEVTLLTTRSRRRQCPAHRP
jgi:proteasome lid subunit RPN8/RPN11